MLTRARPFGRRGGSAVKSPGPVWVMPAVAGVIAMVAARVLAEVDVSGGWWWDGDLDTARGVLQTIATSVVAATTLTFTLTVVVLQLASQQYSPRLLREFGRDPVTKRVLAVLTASFVYSLTMMTELKAGTQMPTAGLAVGFVLGLAAFASVLAFLTHLLRAVRVDTMMMTVHAEASTAIRTFYAPYDAEIPDGHDLEPPEDCRTEVGSHASGFVQRTDVDALVEAARRARAVVRVEVRAGDHVTRGAPIATVWAEPGTRLASTDAARLSESIRDALTFGYERTVDQDVGFVLRQLEDIAVRAMSPSINDPVTAAHAVGHLGDLLTQMVDRRLGATLHVDAAGAARAVVPDRDLRYYLDLSCAQLRRSASSEPTVLEALLRMLRDAGAACHDDEQRAEVARAAALVVEAVDPATTEHDRAGVHDMARRVHLALAGERSAAYEDRAGETRSI